MRVEIDGVLYAPVTAGVQPMTDGLSKKVALECAAGLYFQETHKHAAKLYRILGMVAPGAQKIHDEDGADAAYRSLTETDDG